MVRRRIVVSAAVAAAVAAAASVAYATSAVLSSSRLTVYTECVVRATADASLLEDSGANQGSAQDLIVRSQSPAANARALVRFDLGPCGLQPGSEIASASLQLFLSAAPTAMRTYDAYRVAADWSEGTVVWTNQPATEAAATASAPSGTTGGVWLSWDVKADVLAYAGGSAVNYGWLVRDQMEESVTPYMGTHAAREHAIAEERPRLTVGYYP